MFSDLTHSIAVLAFAALATSLIASSTSNAQSFPSKVIKFVLPLSAGSPIVEDANLMTLLGKLVEFDSAACDQRCCKSRKCQYGDRMRQITNMLPIPHPDRHQTSCKRTCEHVIADGYNRLIQ